MPARLATIAPVGVAGHDEAVAAGRAALTRGAWPEARAAFTTALSCRETAAALEGLSWAAWWLEDVEACLDARERAYRCYRRDGDLRGAARMALWLGDDHVEFRGAAAVGQGWLHRAARLLQDAEPCVEHGWLAVFEAHHARGRHDLPAALRRAREAQAVGRRHHAADLELFALATEGAISIDDGRIGDGLRCLDEAVAAALAGEYDNLAAAAWSCCLLMSACEELRDYARAAEWCAQIRDFSSRLGARFLTGVCRAHLGAVVGWQGRWEESERELLAAVSTLTDKRPSWRPEAVVRLGELRRRQGRLEEAEALFAQAPEHVLARHGMAAVLLERGEPTAARALLERGLRQLAGGTAPAAAGLLELLVRADVALGELEHAATHLRRMEEVASSVATVGLDAAVATCAGLVAAARGDPREACVRFEDAVDGFTRAGASFEAALARVELAGVLAALGREHAAVHEADAAVKALERLGAAGAARRARAVRDAASSRPGTVLTDRQVEVLRLVAEGMSDEEIAARLVLSEHTVHRHVANIFTRLGCSSRAAAVAQAGRLGLL